LDSGATEKEEEEEEEEEEYLVFVGKHFELSYYVFAHKIFSRLSCLL
jgi:hypothetical protein